MQCRNYEILQNGILFREGTRPPALPRRNSITLLDDLCDGFCPRDEMFIVFPSVLFLFTFFSPFWIIGRDGGLGFRVSDPPDRMDTSSFFSIFVCSRLSSDTERPILCSFVS